MPEVALSEQPVSNIQGRRIMVVEDEYMIADDMRRRLEKLGARVIGPFPNARAALKLIESGQSVDGATLDVSLGRDKAFAVADALRARGVPFVFVTGQDDWRVPADYEGVPRHAKPADMRRVAEALFA